MITTNGIVGIALLLGALKHGTTLFNAEGSGAALATVIDARHAHAGAADVHHDRRPAREFSGPQLAFAAIASLVLYGMFVFTQTVRHRDFFLPVDEDGVIEPDEHAEAPSSRRALGSPRRCCSSRWSPWSASRRSSRRRSRRACAAAGFPPSFVGVVIALLVLLPETIAAVRAAWRDRIQTSLNLGYGSAIASIGLTIPTIALATVWLDGPLLLGLGPTQMVLLLLTVLVSVLTVVPGPRDAAAGRRAPGAAGGVPVPRCESLKPDRVLPRYDVQPYIAVTPVTTKGSNDAAPRRARRRSVSYSPWSHPLRRPHRASWSAAGRWPGTRSHYRLLPAPVKAYDIRYRSTSATGAGNVVSGMVLVSPLPWNNGPRPIVAYAMGTQGMADQCAPSQQLQNGTEVEIAFLAQAMFNGWAVAITDYEGLGTPGDHTYAVARSEGRALLDVARAAIGPRPVR